MVGESLAIVAVLLVMAAMYRRAGKKLMAHLALPLICVPCGRLIGIGVLGYSAGTGSTVCNYAFIVGGLVAAVAWCTYVSRNIQNRTVRVGYLAVSFVFSGALLIAYLVR